MNQGANFSGISSVVCKSHRSQSGNTKMFTKNKTRPRQFVLLPPHLADVTRCLISAAAPKYVYRNSWPAWSPRTKTGSRWCFPRRATTRHVARTSTLAAGSVGPRFGHPAPYRLWRMSWFTETDETLFSPRVESVLFTPAGLPDLHLTLLHSFIPVTLLPCPETVSNPQT